MTAMFTIAAAALISCLHSREMSCVDPPLKVQHVAANDSFEFSFGWSAEVDAVPELRQKATEQMATERDRIRDSAEKAWRQDQESFHPFDSTTRYDTAGQSDRLLSIAIAEARYEGGEQGIYDTRGLIWDLKEKRELKLADLFDAPVDRSHGLYWQYCEIYDRKLKNWQSETGMAFSTVIFGCASPHEMSLALVDSDRNGKFDRLHFVTSAYLGDHVRQGDNDIEIPVSYNLLYSLKQEYRDSFEVERK